MPIRLAIVDGHTLTRYGLRELMSQQPDIEIVAESESAAAARADVLRTRPDVVTVDVSLPDGNGMSLAREFRIVTWTRAVPPVEAVLNRAG